ncbi:MAG: PLP-dependent transferase [Gammaproteobacteria bacterium]
MRRSTLAVHAGREDFRRLKVHAPPLDLSTTYPLEDLAGGTACLDAAVEGRRPGDNPVYCRLENPTVARFEEAMAAMEGAESAVAFSSGMAALTACLLAASQRGRHVVAVRPLYGTSDHLLASGLLGLDVTWSEPAAIAGAIRPDTGLVIIETPANPTLSLVDIADVARQAAGVPVAVDSTFATPVLQQPLALGATYSLHSATKFLGGHGDVAGGVVACSEADARPLRQVRLATGGLMHPLAGYLLHRGLPTLAIRVERAQAGAARLAELLFDHPGVNEVLFPGFRGRQSDLLGRQMAGPGAVLSFRVAGGRGAAEEVLERLRLITPAVSLGSVDTLIQHPAGLTHRVVDDDARLASGIDEGLLRLSVGLEDPRDLWDDLAGALDAAGAATRAA